MLKTPSKKTSNKSLDKQKSVSDRECDEVYEAIKRWKAHDGAVLVPVVRKETVTALQERAKPKWWKVKKSESAALCITTPQHVQREIDSTANDGQTSELFLLISRQVDLPELQFDVPASIDNLFIIRCGHAGGASKKPSTAAPNDDAALVNKKLILNGSSTFCGVRLDEWQAKRVDDHNLILAPGVVIQLRTSAMPWTARDAMANISKKQRQEVTQHFRTLCEAKYDGTPEWDQWKGPVNKLLDVAAGSESVTSVVECYANGIVLQAATRLAEVGIEGAVKIGAGMFCLSGGPGHAALLGVGAAAAAVYFVPWETVWMWFKGAFGALMGWLVRAWENLKSWVQNMGGQGAGAQTTKQGVEMRVRPMLTTG